MSVKLLLLGFALAIVASACVTRRISLGPPLDSTPIESTHRLWRGPPRAMIPRLYVDAPLAAGKEIALDPARSHYVRNVLRREAGASVLLFNGRDGEWQASIVDV